MATARRTWIDRGTDVVLDELASFGLDAPRSIIADALRGRAQAVAERLRITEQSARRYLTDDVLRELARDIAAELAEEQPGITLMDAPRNIPVPVRVLGRSVAALAEASIIQVRSGDELGPEAALRLISALGQLIAEDDSPASGEPIPIPQAALTRSSRILETTAAAVRLVDAEELAITPDALPDLATAFEKDAQMLRTLVVEHGFRQSPFPTS
jgi:hypothetical protein